MAPRAAIFGTSGPDLTPDEAAFFRDADPWGFILFARNIDTPARLTRLTADLRDSVGRDAPVLIDQEGGRVARMRAPHWTEVPPALDMADMFAAEPQKQADVMRARGRLIAAELRAVGIDVNCAPLADVARPETHAVLRNRCYGHDADTVARLGRALAEGQAEGGVASVLKHMPGQGRADLDSHADLPRIETDRATLMAEDFAPFRALADLPMGMVAHCVYSAIDPAAPASQSALVTDLIRADLGFSGLLMTDDIGMGALSGTAGARSRRALAAGLDMALHCNGEMPEMVDVADNVPRLAGVALARADAALAARPATGADPAEARACLDELTGESHHA
ncbi:beta-N-acetylhexosaminidase [Oceanomicrobium pacificus]|uniref:beta-N-acetylhexosaminidase n=1 Tax=Oceanomicrobium pacificus TaxID=2692916 RepID=A0A6B0TWU5_9RHOB|nr:beta-N-acetylhexosaminidase [Oceanomicrobium pacificus]MXU65493.1 beta-N-acetylhexosaminidase [Oceanomicrobium pacificus]